jgi:hypothetical protein
MNKNMSPFYVLSMLYLTLEVWNGLLRSSSREDRRPGYAEKGPG